MEWLSRPMKALRFTTVDSTQNVALRNQELLANYDLLIIAETQDKGKGRGEHSWQSPRGGLWFTYATKWTAIPAPVVSRFMHYVAALAALTALEESTALSVSIKWPNDLIYAGKKLGGVLIDLIPMGEVFVLFGIGINTNNHSPLLNDSRKLAAISIRDISDQSIDNELLAQSIILELRKMLLSISQGNFEDIRRRFNDKLFLKGEVVKSSQVKGILRGVDPEGLICIVQSDGMRVFDIGEIELFP